MLFLLSVVALADEFGVNLKYDYSGEFVNISWEKYDEKKYNSVFYTVYRSTDGGKTFRSLSSFDYQKIKEVKVLNVYPSVSTSLTFQYIENGKTVTKSYPKSASLKVWMEGGKIGSKSYSAAGADPNDKSKNIINVTPVTMSYFQSKYTIEMMRQFDVIVFGTWDSNNCEIASDATVEKVKQYLKEGYGVLLGHDLVGSCVGKEHGFGKIAWSHFGIKLGTPSSCTGSSFPKTSKGHYSTAFRWYSEEALILKKGLLTEYPNNITSRTKLTIPLTHTCENTAFGDVWMQLGARHTSTSGNCDAQELTSDKPYLPGYGYRNSNTRFYLTTMNNSAMIQTGHSSGESSDDENKVLANTIYYLKQRNTEKYQVEYSIKDEIKPTVSVSQDEWYNYNHHVSYKGDDPVEQYCYKVESYQNTRTNIISTSNVTCINISSGISGYYYVIDDNENTIVTTRNTYTTDTELQFSDRRKYFHVAARDNKGNLGSTVTIRLIDVPKETQSPMATISASISYFQFENQENKNENQKDGILEGNNLYYIIGGAAGAAVLAVVAGFMIKKLSRKPIDAVEDPLENLGGNDVQAPEVGFENPLYNDAEAMDDPFEDDF